MQEQILSWFGERGIKPAIAYKEILPQDWNKTWEASIQPIEIPPFYVRPSWASPSADLIDIVVDPKMSFGTGHHETTRLLLRLMPPLIESGFNVLDAGAGGHFLSAIELNSVPLAIVERDRLD